MESQKDLIYTVDWDLLVILDACRFDFFERFNDIPGKLSIARSSGSTTIEWVSNTFPESHQDIIYISSIPYVASKYMPKVHGKYKPEDHFFRIVDLWLHAYDDELGTVLPARVIEAVRINHQFYPDKRLIAHFPMPHEPMIGEPPFTIATWKALTGEKENRFPHVVDIFAQGYGELYIKAYAGNLKRVLKDCRDFITGWPGKVAVTADHGEGFGEHGVFGHRAGIRTPELIQVPFHIVEGGKPDGHNNDPEGR